MFRWFRVLLIVSLLVGLAPVIPAAAQQGLPSNCSLVPVPNSIEVYLICLPWPPTAPPPQFDLVVFAHGYVPPNETSMTKYIEQLLLPDGTFIPSLVNSMGYAFASTSYTKNGLAVKEGLADTVRLIQAFKLQYPQTGRVYLIGASEGGLITTLAAEQQSPISGGMALCGPIGNFRSQINYWGDFRVLYDYFFPAARYPLIQIPNSPIDINEAVVWPNWDAISQGIAAAVTTDTSATQQLLATSRAPIDPANPSTAVNTTLGILAYNVFATNEGKVELGGQPYDNKYKWYFGSNNDWALNKGVQRFTADPAALLEINRNYQTSGKLRVPLVTMHTLGDPIVPYWHETLYNVKALLGGSVLKHFNIPIVRYGHCTFTAQEALAGFAILNFMVTGKLPALAPSGLKADAQSAYQALVEKFRSQLPVP